MSKKYLSDVRAIILEQGLGKARTQILAKQLESKGGTTEQRLSGTVTHILVGNNVKLPRILKSLEVESLPSQVLVLKADWLSHCLMKGQRLDHAPYVIPSDDPAPLSSHSLATRQQPSSFLGSRGEDHPPAVQEAMVAHCQGESSEVSYEPSSKQKGVTTSAGTGIFTVTTTTSTTTTTTTTTTITSSTDSTQMTDDITSKSPQKLQYFGNIARRWKSGPIKTSAADSDSDYVASTDDEKDGEEDLATARRPEDSGDQDTEEDNQAPLSSDEHLTAPPAKKGKWICEIPSTQGQSWVNHNKHITDKLQELVKVYQNSNEKWRAMSCTKAIAALRKYPKEITTFEEARSLRFVGERMADKIWEIISSGNLRRLENVDQEREVVISLFTKIHGVGLQTAQQLYAQGYRTLDDLKNSGVLTRIQLIGLKHFHDFNEKMPRAEVEEIEAKVKEVAHSIDPGLEVVTCGSYRRGRPMCGDVDLLITHPDGRSHKGIFSVLLQRCRESGFITDDLSIHDDPAEQCKYLGVCKLPGEGRKHRRIDIIVVPYAQYPCALLHFTGSGHYNRSLRSKANKMGMSLSEYALSTGVVRKNGVKVFEGTPLPVFCERDVFKYLDVQYLEPHDRDWD